MSPWTRLHAPTTSALVATLVLSVVGSGVLLTRSSASGSDATPAAASAYVVVLTGERSADGLIAATLGDAVLTVPASGGLGTLLEQVEVLNPSRLVILGGGDIVSDRAAAALAAASEAPVTRLAGQDRYATAARAALSTYSAPVRQAFVVTPETSLRAARAAGRRVEGTPVLLVTRDHVPAVTLRTLQQLQPQHLTVVGGVSDAVVRQLRRQTGAEVERARPL